MTAPQTRSDAGLASALRISVSRLARRLRAERLARLEPELAEHEKVQPPSMTRVIAVLEDRSLVMRAPHATDRRQVMLTATDQGRDLVQQSRRLREAWLAQRLRELSP